MSNSLLSAAYGIQNTIGGQLGQQVTTASPNFGTTTFPQQGFAWPAQMPDKIEVAIYDVDSSKGIFLRDKNGDLHYTKIADIAVALGHKW